MKDICAKCLKREECETPCRPVELYLKQQAGRNAVFERSHVNEHGEKITIMFCKHNELNESVLPDVVEDKMRLQFELNNESPFRHFEPELKRTGIFVDRFFHGWEFRDLAVKYDVTEKMAMELYARAKRRLQEVVLAMDRKEFVRSRLNQVEEFPKGQKYFLLNRIFAMSPAEIARLEGRSKKYSGSVSQLIIRVEDQLKTGEIQLIKTTQEEREEAEIRLLEYKHKRSKQRKRNRVLKKPPAEFRLQALAVIKEQRKKGATFDEIAELLNARHIPTPSGRGIWEKGNVHGLLRRSNLKRDND